MWLLVPLLALLHGTHAHRFCAAHGTFEDAAPAADDGPRLAVADTAVPRVLHAAPEGFGGGGHEQCPLLGAWARQGLSGPSQAWGTGVSPQEASRAVSLSRVPPQLEPLFTAPKGSPPRA
ncbi:hypothetical protein NR800_00525 [Corallococcus interemptor]|uniref:hypothetical protein n=1 Tax=Corallococcus TaxID=83461 RepID=UPI001CBB0FA9|nr:hypothetical protein [Corallococcus sp. AS-1-6]MBZ4371443.1 hypothetical protein [Corallococcus sp. AS-1-6]